MPITANQSFQSCMYHMPTIHAFEETEAWHLNFANLRGWSLKPSRVERRWGACEILACGGLCKSGWGRIRTKLTSESFKVIFNEIFNEI